MPWAPDYVTPEELAAYVHTDVEEDRIELTVACTAGSRAVDRVTYRQFGQTTAEARFYTPQWSVKRGQWVIECDDLFAVPTQIDVDTAGDGTYTTSVDLAGAVMLPANNPAKGRPYERVALRSGLSVFRPLCAESARLTALWGWSEVPTAVSLGARLQASRFFARRNSPYGVAGSPDQGSEIRLLAKADPDVIMAVKSYRRDVWLS